MLEPKFHVSNSKNKDLLYNCILDKPIHSIDPVVHGSGLTGLKIPRILMRNVVTVYNPVLGKYAPKISFIYLDQFLPLEQIKHERNN